MSGRTGLDKGIPVVYKLIFKNTTGIQFFHRHFLSQSLMADGPSSVTRLLYYKDIRLDTRDLQIRFDLQRQSWGTVDVIAKKKPKALTKKKHLCIGAITIVGNSIQRGGEEAKKNLVTRKQFLILIMKCLSNVRSNLINFPAPVVALARKTNPSVWVTSEKSAAVETRVGRLVPLCASHDPLLPHPQRSPLTPGSCSVRMLNHLERILRFSIERHLLLY